MSPTLAAPSTATTVQESSKNLPVAFKHPLDPLTPDEVHHAATCSARHQALMWFFL
jgi:primary-amine oxidase